MDEMINIVVREKRRPQFPASHGEVNSSLALRLLRDTIEECWDADAEARLSAHCVVERLAQLPQLWDQGASYEPLISLSSGSMVEQKT